MVGGTSKETNWSAAFRDAETHPDGELIGVHGQTLRAMEKTGAAYRQDGKWYMRGKGPGLVEKPKIEEPADEPEPTAEAGASPDAERDGEQATALSSWEVVRRIRADREPRDRPRERFDSALKVLLMRENLRGAEWAIERIIQEADAFPDNTIADILRATGAKISSELDKHVAELAAKED
jgi:hypothetical protein